jgi:EmrB/QacA subfamily drug resistance transporter
MTMGSRILPIIVGIAFFMEQLDSTIIAPAIPDIALSLGVDPLSLNLSMTAYLLCSVAFIPTGAWWAERFGTRAVFQAALAVFALSSIACAASTSATMLIVARAVQGASAALMVPVGRTVIVHVTEKSKLVSALAWMITMAMLGPLLGPMAGGLLTSYASWHWIFLINVPIALVCLAASVRYFPDIRREQGTPFDVLSWTLLSAALATLIVMLESLREGAWSAVGWLLPLGVLSLGYWLRSRRIAHPLLDFSLLRVPTFAASFWSGSLLRVGYGALPFLLPLMLQLGLGFSPVESGLVLLASGVIALVTKTQTTRMLRRWGFRKVMLVNGSLCVLALACCALFSATWSIATIALVVSIAGFFRAVQFNAVTAIAYADVSSQRIAAATTLNTMVQQLAVMAGIALSTTVVSLSAHFSGTPPTDSAHYGLAFLVLAAIGALATPAYLQLGKSAGSHLSGHGS